MNKKITHIIGLALIVSLFAFASCKKDKDDTGKIEQTDWPTLVSQNYEYSMTYVTQVAFSGTVSTNTRTELGAFVGNECRGKANLVYEADLNKYLCHLTIYSNTASGETIKFKAYYPDKKKIYGNCGSITFQNNSSLGEASAVLKCEE